MKKGKGFTIVEMILIITALNMLAAVIIPVFSRARAGLSQASCAGNLQRLGLSLQMYAQDYDQCLPLLYFTDNNGTSYLWSELTPYTIHLHWPTPEPYQQAGADFMRCPCEVPQGVIPTGATGWVGSYSWTYACNWYNIFGNLTSNTPLNKSALINRVPTTVWLLADTCSNYYGFAYNPKNWPLTYDTDGDGIPDSFQPAGSRIGGYNGLAMVHRGGANFLFPDGRVQWVSKADWLANKNNMWGDITPGIYQYAYSTVRPGRSN